MTKEEFYDQQIAPVLLDLCNRCKDRGMAFVACVEYDPENSGVARTEFCPPDTKGHLSAAQRLVHWAARAHGNIDRLFMACDKHGKEHGHGSAYLLMLGNKNVQHTGNETAAFTVISK